MISLTAEAAVDQRIDREALFLAKLLTEARSLPAERLLEMAEESANAAAKYADEAQKAEGRSRLALLWLSGRNSLCSLVYRTGAGQ